METAIIALVLAVASMALSLYRAYITPKILDEKYEDMLNSIDNELKETLQPIEHTVSRVMSDRGTQGASKQQIKTLEKNLALDMIDMKDPMIQEILDLFPNVKQYVNKNPHLILELLPRIQQLQQTPDGAKGFLDGLLPGNKGSQNRKHPFGFDER